MIDSGEQFVGPGVYDPLTAKIVADLGFNGVYLGGFASSAPLVTMEPLMTMTEQVGLAANITKVIGELPLIVDGHTAYGEPVHVTRAVREFEAAGVAGIHIEDQFFPKRASYHKGLKHMVPVEVMEERIDAALRAPSRPRLLHRRQDGGAGRRWRIARRGHHPASGLRSGRRRCCDANALRCRGGQEGRRRDP